VSNEAKFEMSASIAQSYDALPYESQFNPLSHPDRLASMAALYGVNAPPIETCRVLELGCGVGGNAIGIAQSLPRARIVGIDLSPRQVEAGQAVARKLDLKNISLSAMSITDVDDAFGRFDYIICHGVYSWVPDPVQRKILDIGAQLLEPSGVLFLSYNVYPGWFQRGMVRAAMQFHTRNLSDPLERVGQARQFLDFLLAASTPPNTPYTLALKQEADLLRKVSDTYLFHEHLEDENRPVHFHELAARAEAAGLYYLGPARFSLLEGGLRPEVRTSLEGLTPDRIAREQYLDLVLNRSFRQSLFCRAGTSATPEPEATALPRLRFTAMARPESGQPDVVSNSPEDFHTLWDEHITVRQPRMKAAVVILFEHWPRSAGFEELRTETRARLIQEPDERDRTETADEAEADRRSFAATVLEGIGATLIETHSYEPRIASEPGERPCATPLARYQAAAGSKVINLRNGFAVLRDLDRLIVPLLDGSRDRAAILSNLADQFLRGDLRLNRDGQPVTDPAAVLGLLEQQIDASFTRLAAEALLLED
jgi:SAM-dependent methyltransferase/methyltransferase-like protein